ncbi:DUF559 domain-containing protein [Microbacterium fluvii]|uniref:DUF559 domain-containing protein n=1 Tax=Microbacterium fluvii TaxID=415215 RepID=A0ABW2HFA5_9MICO|nr:DUF559 domain-containing protein [Microbacterium fluvii]MCU4672286.1 DUF559 domain-containing protein [Microbacterium fluvii]
MLHPRPLPATLGEAFTREEALEAGATDRRLRAADLERPYRGVRQRVGTDATEDDTSPKSGWEQERAARAAVLRRVRAYALVMEPHAFFIGRTAAVIHGCQVANTGPLDVGVLAPHRAPRHRDIRGFQLTSRLGTVVEASGFRVTDVPTTWATLARDLPLRRLIEVGDALVRIPRDERGQPRPEAQLASPTALRHAADLSRRRGAPKLREAIEFIRVGSASPLETDVRLDAELAGLPEPELDVDIHDREGRRIGITELVYRQQKVVVEIEGDQHRVDENQWNRDIEKYNAYTAEGWEVVRLTREHIVGEHPTAVATVRAALRRRGWRG